eukprot:1687309-Rhodomonas_salina.2
MGGRGHGCCMLRNQTTTIDLLRMAVTLFKVLQKSVLSSVTTVVTKTSDPFVPPEIVVQDGRV